jgi:RNA polymerase sigma factor (TIGR02999 family)
MNESGKLGETGKAEVTRLLERWRGGDRAALDLLMPLVYAELRKLASRSLRRQQGELTLQPTALVAEAYLELVGAEVAWNDRVHFFAVAASMMRNILVAAARRRQARKRGGAERPLSLDQLADSGFEIADPGALSPILQLDQALTRLEAFDHRKAKVIELRCFAGLSIAETAIAMDLSHATVERDLKSAKAWLAQELGATEPAS